MAHTQVDLLLEGFAKAGVALSRACVGLHVVFKLRYLVVPDTMLI